ncbi:MAG: trimeric intracellular cation channel family protein [Campylobacteraceae bacterium]
MNIFEVADIFGIVAFAISGFLVGTREKLDLLGLFLAAYLTALGGGITRDAIADRVPYAFSNMLPTFLVISVVIFGILFKIYKKDKLERNHIFIISDTFGLVSFAIAGAIIALEVHFNIFGVIMLGLLTAVGGSAIRDIMLNRVPFFMVSEFYGTVAIIVAFAIYLLNYFGMLNLISSIIVFAIGVVLRLVGYYRGWKLPRIN